MQKHVELSYGPLAKSLEEQLNEQGFTLGDQRKFLEKLRYSLNMCGIHLMNDAEYKSCVKKLHKKVIDSIKYID